MVNKVLNRLKNPKVIIAVVSGVLMILLNLGLIDEAISQKAMDITNIILSIGITIGILANPDSHIEPDE